MLYDTTDPAGLGTSVVWYALNDTTPVTPPDQYLTNLGTGWSQQSVSPSGPPWASGTKYTFTFSSPHARPTRLASATSTAGNSWVCPRARYIPTGGGSNGTVTTGGWTYTVTRLADNANGTAEFQVTLVNGNVTPAQTYTATFSPGDQFDCYRMGAVSIHVRPAWERPRLSPTPPSRRTPRRLR